MTYRISDELLCIMVEQLIAHQDKRVLSVPFILTHTQVQEYPTETISLTVSLVGSGVIVSRSLPNEKE